MFHKDIVRLLMSVGVFFLIAYGVTPFFVPKCVENNAVSPMVTFQNFYRMEPNSIDVLFMGTSHVYNSMNPTLLFEEYGIESYNLASSRQGTVDTFYWLKEATKYQTPKVLVFEVYGMIPYSQFEGGDIYWNSNESLVRLPIDWMRFSDVKFNAILDLSSKDARITIESMLFPLIRYHERWELLEANDIPGRLSYLQSYRGFKPINTRRDSNDGYSTINESDITMVNGESLIFASEYTDRLMDYCQKKGIKVILVRTPYLGANAEEYVTFKEYAESYGCEYYDFNYIDLYQEIDYNFATDNADDGHANIYGAEKITRYLGEIISEMVSE